MIVLPTRVIMYIYDITYVIKKCVSRQKWCQTNVECCIILPNWAPMILQWNPMTARWTSVCPSYIIYYMHKWYHQWIFCNKVSTILHCCFFSTKNLIDFVLFLSQMIKTKNRYQSDSHQLFYVNKTDNFLLSKKSVTKTEFEIFHFHNGVILWHGCFYEIQVQIIY